MKTIKKEMDSTNNRAYYNKLRKRFLANKEGFCDICSYHNGCNYSRKRKIKRSWKKYRKTQWK